MPCCAGAGFRSAEPDEHRPAGRIANVAHQPVAALATPVEQVMAANGLGMAREAVGEIRGRVSHDWTALSAMLRSGYLARSFSRIAGPDSSVGTNILSFHWMISWKRP